MLDLTSALPTFVITLREGLEAALVVGIVLAYLKKAEQTHLNSWVWNGVVSGVFASGIVGVLFAWFFQAVGSANQMYAPVLKPLLQAGFSVVAIALLSWMLIWMTQQSRLLKAQVEGAVTTTLQEDGRAEWGIFTLIFFAVLREGFETVVFIAAKFQQGIAPVVGAIGGLLVAIILGIALFQLGIKINLRRFFQVMGIFLLLIVAGLVVSAFAHVDLALSRLASLNPALSFCFGSAHVNDSCILGQQLWDTHSILPERQFPGIVLHTLFGYEDQVYLVEAVSYSVFLATVGGAYWRSLTDNRSQIEEQSPISPSPQGE